MAPVIIATDKTQLTQFSGGKTAYPVYLTIGNLPKGIRRRPSRHASILIAYLSVDKFDRSHMTELEHRSRGQRLFHTSMRHILESLRQAGIEGVDMQSSNGDIRRVHPILACYVADYPEQCLVSCSKYGTCPKCCCSADNLQDPKSSEMRTKAWTESIIKAANTQSQGSLAAFHRHCMAHDVAGGTFTPFWEGFPFTDIHTSITPDVLHQLYQGVFKHLIEWCQNCVGKQELDQRIRALPQAFGLKRFKNGISALSQISGSERKNMAKILLGCLVDIMPSAGIKAVKSLLDFIYLAQYSTHSSETLGYLKTALSDFHKNKNIFVDLGCRSHLNLPKLHSLLHYVDSIELFGTTDNYNTEMFERLHIDFAKHGWRATNQRDEFPQMIQWLSRKEKATYFESILLENAQKDELPSESHSNPSRRQPISVSKFPNYPNRPISLIENLHKAPFFELHLKRYLSTLLPTQISNQRVNLASLPFSKVNVYNMFRFHPTSLQDNDHEKDIVRAMPISECHPYGRFDTVVVLENDKAESTGLEGILYFTYSLKNMLIYLGTRIGRVKVIFALPLTIDTPGSSTQSPSIWPKTPLAYIEWYTRQSPLPDKTHGMYHISKATDSQGRIQGTIIPLSNIRQSCMLFPVFKDHKEDLKSEHWNSENILDECKSFYINNWLNHYAYQTLY